MSFRQISFETAAAVNGKLDDGGVRDKATIRGALGRPSATWGGEILVGTLWDQAAVLLHALCTTQGFANGNKRTAWLLTKIFLESNGEVLGRHEDVEAERVINAIAAGEVGAEAIAEWLFQLASPLIAELSDRGRCVFCDVDGDLIGAELFNRNYLRRTMRRPPEALVTLESSHATSVTDDFAVTTFDAERDLVPGVCRVCRDGWIAEAGRGFTNAIRMSSQEVIPVDPSFVRYTSDWMLRIMLLAGVLMPGMGRGWLRDRARVLLDGSGAVASSALFWIVGTEAAVNHEWNLYWHSSDDPADVKDGCFVCRLGLVAFIVVDDPSGTRFLTRQIQQLIPHSTRLKVWPRLGDGSWPLGASVPGETVRSIANFFQ
ncbi:type II toxin-antitoxin system death-on-curing family toxin [Microbacterium sp. NPDC088619]|uniref:type II toxin-antitoxin system death-on-curing family toxin n=1 Tax=Microbacterium sp. NPDC088619 TaxID=3364196 RepID=UPI0037F25732